MTSTMSCEIDSGSQHQDNEEYGHLKILVPAFAVGTIIGPKGKYIILLQEQTRTKIEMSRLHDYYPGTTERVCLISGHREAILRALAYLMKVISEKPYTDPTPCMDHDRKVVYSRGQQVKILVSNKIASKIIGSSGKTIKDIKLRSGSYIQISQTSPNVTVYERCVTVMGEYENNRFACRMILEKIVGDETMGRFLHVSYADITHFIPNSNPTGSPYAKTCPLEGKMQNGGESKLVSPSTSAISCGPLPSTFVPLSSFPKNGPASSAIDVSQIFEILRTTLRNSPFSDEALTNISNALSTLAGYGVLDVCFRILLDMNSHPGLLVNNLHTARPYFEPVFPLYQPTDMNNQNMFLYSMNSHAKNLSSSDEPDRLQTAYEPARNPAEFCFEPSFFSSALSRNAFREQQAVEKVSFNESSPPESFSGSNETSRVHF